MLLRLIYHPNINYALRQTCVISLPVVVGALLGFLKTGLLFSLIPLCCNIAGLDTPHRHFFQRLLIAGGLFALGSYLLQLTLAYAIPLPISVLLLALLFGICNEINPLVSRLLPATLLAIVFTLGMASSLSSWQTTCLFILGTLWYGSFTWLWFRLWQEQPIRETLSQLYQQLATYCETKYNLLTQQVDPNIALPPLLQQQQRVMDTISQLYQQMDMLSEPSGRRYKRLKRLFQIAMDLQEHVTVGLYQVEEMQKLVRQSNADTILLHNAKIIAARLRIIANSILYHKHLAPFNMDTDLGALKKITLRYPDNLVGQFSYYHFSRIARLLKTQRPLYRRNLMKNHDQQSLPVWSILSQYFSFQSAGLRNAARLGLTLTAGSLIGTLFHLPKAYWILLTIMSVMQNGYNATRIRSQHRAIGTLIGLVAAAGILHLNLSLYATLLMMLGITFLSYFVLRQNYALAMIGLTITAVYLLQLLTVHASEFLLPRFIDTLIGCALAFMSMIWLWPQWQSGLLRKHAYQALEVFQQHILLLLKKTVSVPLLSYSRMQVNQAHNTLFNSFNQAMQEPSFNSDYLSEMHSWITHSQFIVEHLNAMTILVREENHHLPSELAAEYLTACEIALKSCQQRLEHDALSLETKPFIQPPNLDPSKPSTIFEMHLRRLLSHCYSMNAISSLAWRQHPRHKARLLNTLRKKHNKEQS